MKHLRIAVIFIVCVAMAMIPAAIAEGLSAAVDGSVLRVRWNVDCAGAAVLTVYQNNWPIAIFDVNCGDGGANIDLGKPSGKYSVRLNTGLGCLTASASFEESKPQATAEPTAVPTEAPTQEPTVEPTAAPTATPTAEITPSPAPTATPTVTPSPTPVITAAPTANSGNNRTDLASEVVALVNAERASAGLPALRVNSELTRAACVRAQELVRLFSHTRPDGTSWSTVSSGAHGENIAMGYRSASAVMTGWMNSQGHRENILRSRFGSIGVCAYTYGGTTYWVQLFGY